MSKEESFDNSILLPNQIAATLPNAFTYSDESQFYYQTGPEPLIVFQL